MPFFSRHIFLSSVTELQCEQNPVPNTEFLVFSTPLRLVFLYWIVNGTFKTVSIGKKNEYHVDLRMKQLLLFLHEIDHKPNEKQHQAVDMPWNKKREYRMDMQRPWGAPKSSIAIFLVIALGMASRALFIASSSAVVMRNMGDANVVDLSIALASSTYKRRSNQEFEGGMMNAENVSSLSNHSISQGQILPTVVDMSRTSHTANLSNCFPFNSYQWLTSKKIQNAEGTNLLDASLEILLPPSFSSENGEKNPQLQAALDETLCLEGSRFLTPFYNMSHEDNKDSVSMAVRIWTTRIVYLATTFHQHYLAWEEYNHRRRRQSTYPSPSCQAVWDQLNISHNDFECPKAKFLVIPLGDNGYVERIRLAMVLLSILCLTFFDCIILKRLGANFKLGAMAALKASLATGRVALYINSFNHTKHRWLQKPWTLASCPRRDYQCFFRPPSPCVLTHEEYQTAHFLNKSETRMLFRQGSLPHLEHERVVVYTPNFRPQREPPRMRERLARIGIFLVQQGLIPNNDIIQKAIQRIKTPVDERAAAFEGDDELAGGLLLYVSRPRPEHLEQLRLIQDQIVNTQDQSSTSIGLPIRASDKCGVESECFDFDVYIRAAHDLWFSRWPIRETNLTVLITTESTDILEQERAWVNSKMRPSWQRIGMHFVHNSFDVTQDTGLIRSVSPNHSSADEVMLSSLSSLRAQLSHRVVLGNCCSNFHRLIQMLVNNGCASDWNAEFVCLQDHPNEAYRLCCAWDKSDKCTARIEKNRTIQ